MAAINCCNFEDSCKDLVTLGYMKEMANGRGCTQVSGGSAFTSCCSADASAYTPTFGEISGGTYASARIYDNTNPSNDNDGFSATTSGGYNACCGTIGASDKCVTKNELYYGTTELSSITFSTVEAPYACSDNFSASTSFTVREKDTYVRRTFGCQNDEIQEIETILIDTNENISSSLTKNYGAISSSITIVDSIIYGSAESHVSFVPLTITKSKYKNKCGEDKISGETTISLNGYDSNVVVLCPRLMACEGGGISAITNSPCSSDVSFSATLDTIEISGETSGNTIIYKVGRNINGIQESTFVLGLKIGTQTKNFEVTFNRQPCSISPTRANPTPCGAFPTDDDWCNQGGYVIVHNADGTIVDCS